MKVAEFDYERATRGEYEQYHVAVLCAQGGTESWLVKRLEESWLVPAPPPRPDHRFTGTRAPEDVHIGVPSLVPHALFVPGSGAAAAAGAAGPLAGGSLVRLHASACARDGTRDVAGALRMSDNGVITTHCLAPLVDGLAADVRSVASEGMTPLLFLDGLHEALADEELSLPSLYAALWQRIEEVNLALATGSVGVADPVRVEMRQCTVQCGSSRHGWSFSLQDFAAEYAAKLAMPQDEFLEKMWGGFIFHPSKKRWEEMEGAPSPHSSKSCAFVRLVLCPLREVIRAARTDPERLASMAEKLHLGQSFSQVSEQTGDSRSSAFLRCWLPLERAFSQLLRTALVPASRATERLASFAKGDMYSVLEAAAESGPAVVDVVKYLPCTGSAAPFLPMGRVVSGILQNGQELYVLSEGKKGAPHKVVVERILLPFQHKTAAVPSAVAGHVVLLETSGTSLTDACTLSDDASLQHLTPLYRSIRRACCMAIEPLAAQDMPRLVQALRWLAHVHCEVAVGTRASGEHCVYAATPALLRRAVENTQTMGFPGLQIRTSNVVPCAREGVCGITPTAVLAKSPNKHNRLWAEVGRLPEPMVDALQTGAFHYPPMSDPLRSSALKDFGISPASGRLWAVGPEQDPACALFESTKMLRCIDELRAGVASGFHMATAEGPLCGDPLHGVQVNLMDASYYADAIHRGVGQLLPTARRVVYGGMLSAEPTLALATLECNALVMQQFVDVVLDAVQSAGAEVLEVTQACSGLPSIIQCQVPVEAHDDVIQAAHDASDGDAVLYWSSCGWSALEGRLDDPQSALAQAVARRRLEGGLSEEPHPASFFLDKL